MTNIEILRNEMRKRGIAACIIPTADPFLSEYTAEHYAFRSFLCPFSGSAGTLAVTLHGSGLWTDGRYYIQAERELSGTETELFRASEKGTEKIHEYLCRVLEKGDAVCAFGELFSRFYLDRLRANIEKCGLRLVTDVDFSYIQSNRPPLPNGKIFMLPDKYTGENAAAKLARLREKMREKGATHYVIGAADCVMWMLNIRGSDVEYTPVTLCFMLVSETDAVLYINPERADGDVASALSECGVRLRRTEEIYSDISALPEKAVLAADFSKTNYALTSSAKCGCRHFPDFVGQMKCIKNAVEIQNIKQAYIYENVALIKSFYEIYNSERRINECDVSDIIEKNRRANADYMYPSFSTIAAFGANAAMMHYSPKKDKCSEIGENGMLLIDTGAQFPFGTTDTTRTLVFGKLTDEQRENYTLVLKANIALANAVFPQGTAANVVDCTARMPLWKKMLDYRCGTGHGVGCCLCVHEDPPRLSPSAAVILQEGMTVTDEPGVYIENEYGIRIENHLCVVCCGKSEYGTFLAFEPLNYCPVGTAPIAAELLGGEEKAWLNAYNKEVRRLSKQYLTKEEFAWLTQYTKEI